MSSPPAVTIVTALHNAEAFIADTLESVSSQTFTDWEHLIVDDASTDTGPEIVRRSMESDERIRLITLSQNSGPAVARNAAIRESSGRYIAFLDSDDQWLPEKLAHQLTFMKETSSPFTYTWFEKVLENGQGTGRVRRPPDRLTYDELLKEDRIRPGARVECGAEDLGVSKQCMRTLNGIPCTTDDLGLRLFREGAKPGD